METIVKANVGIDMSKDTFWATITIRDLDYEIKHLSSKEFPNTDKGFVNFTEWAINFFSESVEMHFTMEATGVYYECLANYLFNHNYIVHVVLPNKSKNFIKSLDVKSKTDKIDSKSLGQLGLERKLRAWQPIQPIYKEIKSLTRERGSLIKFRTKQKNTLHALKSSYKPNKERMHRTEANIAFLDKQVKAVEKQIANEIKKDIELKEKVKRIMTIPGVGFITAVVIIAETNGFAFIENVKQLTSYVGLDVKLAESGKWKGHCKISKQGNSHIRAILYYPALTAKKISPQHKIFYERILKGKKKFKVANTAVQRKILILIYSIWKNNKDYQALNQNKKVA